MAKAPKDPAACTVEALLRRESIRLRTAKVVGIWQSSPLYRFCRAIRETVTMTDLRAISLLFAPAGLAAFGRCLILPLLTDDFPLLVPDGIAGILLTFLSLLLSTYHAPLHRALTEDAFLSRLFFDTLALPRPYPSAHRGIPFWLLLLPGLGLGALTVFVSPLRLTVTLAVVLIVSLALVSPEFGLVLLGIFYPLAALLPRPLVPILTVIGLSLLSYLLKLLLGKRRFTLAPTDLLLLLFALLLLLSGVFSTVGIQGGTVAGLAAALLLIGGYFLAANLLATRRILLLFARGLVFGGALLAVCGIFCRSVTLFVTAPLPEALTSFYELMQRVTGDESSYTALLFLLFPLLPAVLLEIHGARWRLLPSLLLLLTALALSPPQMIYLVLLFSLPLFLLAWREKPSVWYFLLVGILPHLLMLLLPEEILLAATPILTPLGIDTLFTEYILTQKAALALLTAHPLGLGLGSAIVDTASLPLQLALLSGIPTLGMLLLLFLSAYAVPTSPRFRLLTAGARTGLFAFLLFGLFHATAADYRILLLLSLVLGLLTALRRAVREEERLSYAAPEGLETAATEVRLSRKTGR